MFSILSSDRYLRKIEADGLLKYLTFFNVLKYLYPNLDYRHGSRFGMPCKTDPDQKQ